MLIFEKLFFERSNGHIYESRRGVRSRWHSVKIILLHATTHYENVTISEHKRCHFHLGLVVKDKPSSIPVHKSDREDGKIEIKAFFIGCMWSQSDFTVRIEVDMHRIVRVRIRAMQLSHDLTVVERSIHHTRPLVPVRGTVLLP